MFHRAPCHPIEASISSGLHLWNETRYFGGAPRRLRYARRFNDANRRRENCRRTTFLSGAAVRVLSDNEQIERDPAKNKLNVPIRLSGTIALELVRLRYALTGPP
jgi:hypothetical protein